MLCRIKNNEQKAFIFIEQKFFFVSTIFFLSTFKICYVNIVIVITKESEILSDKQKYLTT